MVLLCPNGRPSNFSISLVSPTSFLPLISLTQIISAFAEDLSHLMDYSDSFSLMILHYEDPCPASYPLMERIDLPGFSLLAISQPQRVPIIVVPVGYFMASLAYLALKKVRITIYIGQIQFASRSGRFSVFIGCDIVSNKYSLLFQLRLLVTVIGYTKGLSHFGSDLEEHIPVADLVGSGGGSVGEYPVVSSGYVVADGSLDVTDPHDVLKFGLDSNGFICNSVLNISRRLGDAFKLLDVMYGRSGVSYATLIKGYAQNDWWSEAMELLREMRNLGIMLNEVTLATVISACSDLGGIWDCRMLQSLAIKLKFVDRFFVSTNLMLMYFVCPSNAPNGQRSQNQLSDVLLSSECGRAPRVPNV